MTVPGSYVLANDITGTGTGAAFEIQASDVTVNLNGHTITSRQASGIIIDQFVGNNTGNATLVNAHVSNGRIVAAGLGVGIFGSYCLANGLNITIDWAKISVLAFLCERSIIDGIKEAEAGFRSLTEAIDTTTAPGRMMMQMDGAFAEFDREILRERTSWIGCCPQAGLHSEGSSKAATRVIQLCMCLYRRDPTFPSLSNRTINDRC